MARFEAALRSDSLALSAELTLQRESGADDVRRQADELAPWIDGIQVTDNPYAWVQMSALSASALLLRDGHEAVPIMTCRDRNRRALSSDLQGLKALGASSVMLMRGHRVPENHVLPATTVFDLTGRELIGLAEELGGLCMGTGVRVFRADREWRADALRARAGTGACFLQTQLCFNLDILRHWMRRFRNLGLHQAYGVMVSLSPLPSAKTAGWIKNNLHDSRIPDALISRLQDADDEAREGVAICAETIEAIAEIEGVAGIHLVSTGDPQAIVRVIDSAGLRKH